MVVAKKKEDAPEKVEQKNNQNVVEATLKIVKLTAAERIKKAEQFEVLTKRFQLLSDKKNELDKFLLADDGLQGVSMYLEGGNKTFEISNTSVIKELVSNSGKKLVALIDEAEKEILAFTI